MVICLKRSADGFHMFQLMPLHPKTPSSLASFKSRLVLPFWYSLMLVVLEKRPFNGCSSSRGSGGDGGGGSGSSSSSRSGSISRSSGSITLLKILG